jgi:hypothetical protein
MQRLSIVYILSNFMVVLKRGARLTYLFGGIARIQQIVEFIQLG